MSLTNKTVLSYVSLIAFGLLSLLLGTSIGTVSISFLDILKVIVNKVMPTPIFENIESMQENIIWNIRLPRVLLAGFVGASLRSEEHTSELQSRGHLVCRLLLEKKKVMHAHRRLRPRIQ